MLAEIYNIWVNIIEKKLLNDAAKIKKLNIADIYNLINLYNKKYFNFNLNPKIKNDIIYTIFYDKIKDIEVVEDEIDNIIPGQRSKIINLPVLKIEKIKKNIIIIDKNAKKEITTNELNIKANRIAIIISYIQLFDRYADLSEILNISITEK